MFDKGCLWVICLGLILWGIILYGAHAMVHALQTMH